MKKVVLFGSTGNLGKEIAKVLIKEGYDVTLVVRSKEKASTIKNISDKIIIANPCEKSNLSNCFIDQEIVISAFGKSVSPNDKSTSSFYEVDFLGNKNILEEAKKVGIKKFVYVSAFHSEKYQHLNYFKVHHEFSDLLIQSGINYSIIKPPAIFSAFVDMLELAKKGQLITIGDGNKKTNPIYEGDLATIIVHSILQKNLVLEAGGKHIYTRKELNEIIQKAINPTKKIRHVPFFLFSIALPLIKLFNKNTYDKFSFFIEVMKHETIAPQLGELDFKTYIENRINNKN